MQWSPTKIIFFIFVLTLRRLKNIEWETLELHQYLTKNQFDRYQTWPGIQQIFARHLNCHLEHNCKTWRKVEYVSNCHRRSCFLKCSKKKKFSSATPAFSIAVNSEVKTMVQHEKNIEFVQYEEQRIDKSSRNNYYFLEWTFIQINSPESKR